MCWTKPFRANKRRANHNPTANAETDAMGNRKREQQAKYREANAEEGNARNTLAGQSFPHGAVDSMGGKRVMKHVVIADDSALARMFIRRCLEIAGLSDANFVEAVNGEDALSKMKDINADLLVTDLTMPEMDGVELMRRISSSPRLSGTPVLVVTSAGNEHQREELLSLGVSRILSKPISPPIVAEALENVFAS